jgi:hypothetical protein
MSQSIPNIRRRGPNSWTACAFAVVAFACALAMPLEGVAADKPKEQQISRVIAKEITAAQKAMQASQWSEMIKQLEAAEQKSPLTTYDKKTIYDFKGFAYIKMNNLKAAQAAYEQAMATGGYTPEELTRTNRMLFQLAAGNQQFAKALEYGKTATESPAATPNDFLIMTARAPVFGPTRPLAPSARPANNPRKCCTKSSCNAPATPATTRPWLRPCTTWSGSPTRLNTGTT